MEGELTFLFFSSPLPPTLPILPILQPPFQFLFVPKYPIISKFSCPLSSLFTWASQCLDIPALLSWNFLSCILLSCSLTSSIADFSSKSTYHLQSQSHLRSGILFFISFALLSPSFWSIVQNSLLHFSQGSPSPIFCRLPTCFSIYVQDLNSSNSSTFLLSSYQSYNFSSPPHQTGSTSLFLCSVVTPCSDLSPHHCSPLSCDFPLSWSISPLFLFTLFFLSA